jgi:hypothetical protein
MPPYKMHRARLLCGMPLWQLPSLQVDYVRPPEGLAKSGSDTRQQPVQATVLPFGDLSNDLHPPLPKTKNQGPRSQAKMSCRLSRRQEMPFLSQSIFSASGLYVPPCRSNRAGLSWMRGVAMHRMQPSNCPIVPRPRQLPAGPILRFSEDSLAVAVTRKSYGRGQLLRTGQCTH